MRDGIWIALGRAAVLLVCLFASGCSQIYLTQGPDEMLVRDGDGRRTVAAAPHAELFLDYALLADQSYADSLYDRKKPFDVGPDTYCRGRQHAGDPCRDTEGLTGEAIARLRAWRLIYAEKNLAAFPCRRGDACHEPLGGLGVQVWVRRGHPCSEAAIVFRGTDGRSADDWLSNLRWLLRVVPFYDQYDQVADYTPDFISRLEQESCFQRGRTRIVAIGHSLGGGLAQHAAFRDPRIRQVTAIDPSFVTGTETLDWDDVKRNAEGLGIDRLYEHGEILAYPRFVLRQLSPLPTCDPLIRTIRLNTIQGSALDRHSLASMTTALLHWSKTQRKSRMRADVPIRGPGPTSCRGADLRG